MRRSKLTAGPRRVRLHVGALGLLFLSAAPFAAAHAFQVTPPDAATKAAMEKRTAARTILPSAIARLASNATDSAALLDAGRASIELEDYRAALEEDLVCDQADHAAGRKLDCPVLVLWPRGQQAPERASPAEIWQGWAEEVDSGVTAGGHLIPEDSPEEVIASFRAFFSPEPKGEHDLA